LDERVVGVQAPFGLHVEQLDHGVEATADLDEIVPGLGERFQLEEQAEAVDIVKADLQLADPSAPTRLDDPNGWPEPHQQDRVVHRLAVGDTALMLDAGAHVCDRTLHREPVLAGYGAKPREADPDSAVAVVQADGRIRLIVLHDPIVEDEVDSFERCKRRRAVLEAKPHLDLDERCAVGDLRTGGELCAGGLHTSTLERESDVADALLDLSKHRDAHERRVEFVETLDAETAASSLLGQLTARPFRPREVRC
jgi:hypothetical protein